MHVIIEGFDGTGKSTLCNLLAEATGWPVIHQAPYRPETESEARLVRHNAMLSTKQNPDLISDRWPAITDYCYRSLRKDGDLESVVAVLRAADVSCIIHCDVEAVGDLRIEPRRGDERDREWTNRVRAIAVRVLVTYRELMGGLNKAGIRVHRYTPLGPLCDNCPRLGDR